VVTVGALLTGVHLGRGGVFVTYYGAFPLMTLMMLFLFATGYASANLQLALSFGARRQDYFWALLGALLLSSLVCTALQMGMAALPEMAGWRNPQTWNRLLTMGTNALLSYPFLCLSLQLLGALSGVFMARSRVLGVVLFFISILLGIASVVLLLMFGNDQFVLWGDLPTVLFGIFLLCDTLCLWYLHRYIGRSVVR